MKIGDHRDSAGGYWPPSSRRAARLLVLPLLVVSAALWLAACAQSQSGPTMTAWPSSSAGPLACAVGADGLILLYDQAEGRWAQAASPTSSDLKDVDFADAAHGWAVGADGTVITTADGGLSWRLVPGVGHALRLEGVAALGPRSVRLLAINNDGDGKPLVLTTGDGGDNWRTIPLRAGRGRGVGITFADSRHGWIALGPGSSRLMVTGDGGLTWRRVPLGRGRWAEEVACSGRRVWVAGGRIDRQTSPFILESKDAGESWTAARVPSGPQGSGSYVGDVAFAGEQKGWAVCAAEPDLLLTSEHDGTVWRFQDYPGFREYPDVQSVLNEIAAVNEDVAFVTTTGQEILQTFDGGRTWTTSSLPGRHDGLHGICPVQAGH